MASQLVFSSSDLASFVIVHRRRSEERDVPFVFQATRWQFWETCLRRLAFGSADQAVESLQPGDEIYQGEKAYEFLLQIICGLHSPIKGETEVQGQFKTFFEAVPQGSLKALFRQAYADSKVVREAHLRGLGSQSYGSITRRKIRECSQVDIVGGGHLTREILPWLLKLNIPVRIHVREAEKLQELKARHPQIEVCSLHDHPKQLGGVIIAAPVKSHSLMRWAGEEILRAEMVLDFRAESANDPLALAVPYLQLQTIFAEIEAIKGRVIEQVEKAQNHIKEKVYASQDRRPQE
jgi:glutamyl-tRNA reductase